MIAHSWLERYLCLLFSYTFLTMAASLFCARGYSAMFFICIIMASISGTMAINVQEVKK